MKSKVVDRLVSDKAFATKADAERAFDSVFGAVQSLLQNDGDAVRVSGFGTFKKKLRQGRTGRNPRTGEPVQIAAREVISFSPSKTA